MSSSEKVTFNQAPHLAGDQLCWCRRKMGCGDSILIIYPLSKIYFEFHILIIFLIGLRVSSCLVILIWSQATIRFQLSKLMYERQHSNLKKAFFSGCSSPLAYLMLEQHSWVWWMIFCGFSQTLLWFNICITSSSFREPRKNICSTSSRSWALGDNTICIPI